MLTLELATGVVSSSLAVLALQFIQVVDEVHPALWKRTIHDFIVLSTQGPPNAFEEK
jgi:hypothetical protein